MERPKGSRTGLALIAAALALAAGAASAASTEAYSIARVFTSKAVLQRDRPICVWGRGTTGQGVAVTLKNGATTLGSAMTTIDEAGDWEVALPQQAKSSAGYTMTVAVEGTVKTTLTDLWVGDVWLAAGQSNMDYSFADMTGTEAGSPGYNMIQRLKGKKIRSLYRSTVGGAAEEQPYNPPGNCEAWKDATQNAGGLSSAFAVALAEREPDLPIGVMTCSAGGTPLEFFLPPAALAELGITPGESAMKRMAGGLWNQCIAPLTRYAICGMIWNQGENNAAQTDYNVRLAALAKAVRGAWGRKAGTSGAGYTAAELPFYWCQLANSASKAYNSALPTPAGKETYPACRELMRQALETIDNGGMAVQLDLGLFAHEADFDYTHETIRSYIEDKGAIHYIARNLCGERLARCALHFKYGRSELAYSGPMLKTVTAESGKLRLAFMPGTAKGLTTGSRLGGGDDYKVWARNLATDAEPVLDATPGAVKGFAISADGTSWVWADAAISGSEVVLSSAACANPQYVKYCHNEYGNAMLNLYNDEKLPAVPFGPVKAGYTFQPTAPLGGEPVDPPKPPEGHTHVWSDWTTTTEPTCEGKGLETRTCTAAGCTDPAATETQEIGVLGHDEVIDPRVEPTETETGLTEGKHCSRCGKVLVEQKVIPIPGAKSWTVENGQMTDGDWTFTCTVSGANVTVKTVVTQGASTDLDFTTVNGGELKVTQLGSNSNLFMSNKTLTSVVAPDVTRVTVNTFSGCTALERVEIPKATTLDMNAFNRCSALTHVEMPSVTTIGRNVFYLCTALAEDASTFLPSGLSVPETESAYSRFQQTALTGELVLPEGVKRVNDADFLQCKGLTKVTSKTTDALILDNRTFGYSDQIAEYDFTSLADTARLQINTSANKSQSTLCGVAGALVKIGGCAPVITVNAAPNVFDKAGYVIAANFALVGWTAMVGDAATEAEIACATAKGYAASQVKGVWLDGDYRQVLVDTAGEKPQPEGPTVDGEAVEPAKVFETATSAKPIEYPSAPEVKGTVGEQTITYGGITVAVPVYYTATLAGSVVTLALNDNAKPSVADEDATKAFELTADGKVKLHLENVHAKLYYALATATALDGAWMTGEYGQGKADFEVERDSTAPACFYRVDVCD